ncbi:uncharacterized protein Hap1MRO34_022283 isoform 3-T3 [Clarias gariepinus]|uniref:uncharacterized protein LOC128508750 isoform X4 n=1 Tax=Clarias gariepinus TaxID=13013 RepID=UPI00234D96C3|nr:uncharacterized protein LOC128508750 isoform X4 [Clarias gariepinus]
METSRVALIALVCVVFSSQKRISGAEVEMRVRRGDDVTLYSDCVEESGLYPMWFRNCSEKDHPRFNISAKDIMSGTFLFHSFVFNASTKAHDLLIKNVTESDLGLYYCALHGNKIKNNSSGITYSEVYYYGNRLTRLSLDVKDDLTGCDKTMTLTRDEPGSSDVFYVSLDIQPFQKKTKKKKRPQHFDFSTYSEVITERC